MPYIFFFLFIRIFIFEFQLKLNLILLYVTIIFLFNNISYFNSLFSRFLNEAMTKYSSFFKYISMGWNEWIVVDLSEVISFHIWYPDVNLDRDQLALEEEEHDHHLQDEEEEEDDEFAGIRRSLYYLFHFFRPLLFLSIRWRLAAISQYCCFVLPSLIKKKKRKRMSRMLSSSI